MIDSLLISNWWSDKWLISCWSALILTDWSTNLISVSICFYFEEKTLWEQEVDGCLINDPSETLSSGASWLVVQYDTVIPQAPPPTFNVMRSGGAFRFPSSACKCQCVCFCRHSLRQIHTTPVVQSWVPERTMSWGTWTHSRLLWRRRSLQCDITGTEQSDVGGGIFLLRASAGWL